MNLNEIKESLIKATNDQLWTNFNDREYSKIVYEYDQLTENTCDIIAECKTVEMAEFIANAPQWLETLVSEVERLQAIEGHAIKRIKAETKANADYARQVEEMQKTLERIAEGGFWDGERYVDMAREQLARLKGDKPI